MAVVDELLAGVESIIITNEPTKGDDGAERLDESGPETNPRHKDW
jgi:hypothetical protein